MSIIFRCPQCEHKLRAADEAAGKLRKCKCGASVTVPAADGAAHVDDEEALRGAWRLEPKFKPAGSDLCEAITAWSPLCAQKPPPPSPKGSLPGYWQGMLVGAAGMVIASFILVGLVYAFWHSPADQLTAQETNEHPVPDENAVEPRDEQDRSLAVKTVVKPTAGEKGEPTREPIPPAKKVVPDNSAVKVEKKPAPIVPDKIEIVDWYTTGKLTIIGDTGKEEVLELQEDAVKAGLVFVAVKARLAGRILEGKMFVVEKDIALHTPGAIDPFFAIGCAINDQLWFAPSKGQHPYAAPKDGQAVQSWVFFAALKDLQTGRTTFQIQDERAVVLTLSARRP